MMRDSSLSDWETPAQPPTADLGLLRDVLEDFKPPGIRQRLGDPLELLGLHCLLTLRNRTIYR
jgi:hypothetical protein